MISSRKDLSIGLLVRVLSNGEEREGYILNILSKEDSKKGILVELTSGVRGRVIEVVSKRDVNFQKKKTFNNFMSSGNKYGIWDNANKHYAKFLLNSNYTVLVFSDKTLASRFLSSINNDKQYSVRVLSNKKPLSESLGYVDPKYVLIDMKLNMSFDKFKKQEIFFKNI